MKSFWRIFFMFSFAFFIINVLVNALINHAAFYHFPGIIIESLLFGVILSGWFRRVHKKYMSGQNAVLYEGIVAKKYIVVNANFQDTYQRCLKVVDMLAGFQIQETKQEDGTIRLRVRMSWRSWGEYMLIRVTDQGDTCQVYLESRPRLKTTIADSGKGADNILRIVRWLLPGVIGQ